MLANAFLLDVNEGSLHRYFDMNRGGILPFKDEPAKHWYYYTFQNF